MHYVSHPAFLLLIFVFPQAKERDHRRIAAKQELVMFHELSAGSAFWLPHGARIYNKLIEFIKSHYWKRGYDEVITLGPNPVPAKRELFARRFEETDIIRFGRI